MCGSSTRTISLSRDRAAAPPPLGPAATDDLRGTATPPTGPGRVGDAERRDVDGLLAQAMAQGYLTLDEWRVRSEQVLLSTTRDGLAATTADLPVAELRRTDPVRRAARAASARQGMRAHTAGFLGLAVLMIAIWLAIAIPTGAWYPWPVWPILGTGIGLVSHLVPARAALRQT